MISGNFSCFLLSSLLVWRNVKKIQYNHQGNKFQETTFQETTFQETTFIMDNQLVVQRLLQDADLVRRYLHPCYLYHHAMAPNEVVTMESRLGPVWKHGLAWQWELAWARAYQAFYAKEWSSGYQYQSGGVR